MDLHGLHVAEALAQLATQIGAMQGGTNGSGRLTVVTGAGVHTKVPTPASVHAHLEQQACSQVMRLHM